MIQTDMVKYVTVTLLKITLKVTFNIVTLKTKNFLKFKKIKFKLLKFKIKLLLKPNFPYKHRTKKLCICCLS